MELEEIVLELAKQHNDLQQCVLALTERVILLERKVKNLQVTLHQQIIEYQPEDRVEVNADVGKMIIREALERRRNVEG